MLHRHEMLPYDDPVPFCFFEGILLHFFGHNDSMSSRSLGIARVAVKEK